MHVTIATVYEPRSTELCMHELMQSNFLVEELLDYINPTAQGTNSITKVASDKDHMLAEYLDVNQNTDRDDVTMWA